MPLASLVIYLLKKLKELPVIMENQLEKHEENKSDTGFMKEYVMIRQSRNCLAKIILKSVWGPYIVKEFGTTMLLLGTAESSTVH